MTKASIVRRQPRRSAALVRDPFYSDMDRLFSEFVRPSSLLGHWVGEGLRDTWVPPVDVRETDSSYVFAAELPGLTKDDVEITLEDNLLTLSGEREVVEKSETETYHRIERSQGKFSRSFSLPSQVDSTKVAATFQDGVLTIEVPKSEQAKPRRIEIR